VCNSNRVLLFLLVLFLLPISGTSAAASTRPSITIVTPTNSTYGGPDPWAKYLPLNIEVNEKISGPISYSLNGEGEIQITPLFLLNQSATPTDLSSFSNPVDASSIFCDDQKCVYNESAVLVVENTPALDSIKDEISVSLKNVNFSKLNSHTILIEKEKCWLASIDSKTGQLSWEIFGPDGGHSRLLSNSKISTNTLYNFTFDFNGGRRRIFINGKPDAVDGGPIRTINSANEKIYINGKSVNF